MENIKIECPKECDLRVQKTQKALYDALAASLEQHNFNSITVHELCSKAWISRAAFYSHFRDKYDLLDYLLSEVRACIVKDVYNYDELEREINQFVYANQKLISNIVKDASSETMALIRNFMSSIVELTIKRKVSEETSPQHIILFNFFIGGLVNLLTWIVENNFPPKVTMMNRYLYKMLEAMTIWDAEQGETEDEDF